MASSDPASEFVGVFRGESFLLSSALLLTMSSGDANVSEMMARIEAQVKAQMGEVFREQVTEKCFNVCADVSKKQMSSRETACVEKCLFRFIDAMNVVTEALANRSNRGF
ncbi:unnamed protein product [Agarophyton chilense]